MFLRHAEAVGLVSLVDEVLARGTLEGVAGIPEPTRRLFVSATEIPPAQHLRIQQVFQRHVDNAVSKTINLPEEASPAEIGRVYRQALELGLKGITVYWGAHGKGRSSGWARARTR